MLQLQLKWNVRENKMSGTVSNITFFFSYERSFLLHKAYIYKCCISVNTYCVRHHIQYIQFWHMYEYRNIFG